MTASAPIVGTLRDIPDAASTLPAGSGVPAHANFRSVLEQYQSSRESASDTDADHSVPQKKQKDSATTSSTLPANPVGNPMVPQAVTPPAEPPRLLLPFTTSITLRQDPTASPADDATPHAATATHSTPQPSAATSGTATALLPPVIFRSTFDLRSIPLVSDSKPVTLQQETMASPNDAATLDSTTATDPTPQPSRTTSGPANTLVTPAILRSTFELRGLPVVSDSRSLPIPGATPPKTQAKGQAKLVKESAPSQDDSSVAPKPVPTAPDDPSTPLLPVTASSTFQPATTAAQTTSTVSEVSELVPAATPAPAPAFTVDRRSAYQFHSSPERLTEPPVINRAAHEPQKISDSTPAAAVDVTAPIPVPVINTVEAPPPVRPPAGAPASRQTSSAAQNNSVAVTEDSSAPAATDPTTAMPPMMGRAEDSSGGTPAPQGSLAFAARLSPAQETPSPAPDSDRTTDSQPRPQTTLQTPVTARPSISEADVQPDAHSGESGSASSDQEKMSERFAKLETLPAQTHAATADQPASAPASHASTTSPLSVAARMDQVQEAPPAPSSGNRDITIRIPDATTDQSTAVRFVERAGEVHVSVRTSDTEMAQTLRGGLNDLVTRLEDGGIRTQVWQPGADASTSQNNSQQPFADPDGSNGRQYSSGSNSEQESKQQNKPRWVEELEDSIGAQNSKETSQLWQA